MKTFKKEYRDLEMKVMASLRDAINNSKHKSKHCDEKVIKIDLYDYTELAIINDRLTFLDDNGMHYNIFVDASLEDLIDILNK